MWVFTTCDLLCLCILFGLVYSSDRGDEMQHTDGRTDEMGACYSLDMIMSVLNKSEYSCLPQVTDLISTYHYNCYLRDLNSLPKNSLFVVVEAPRRRKRFLLAKRLAKTLHAALMFSPPMGWSKFREEFNNSVELRRAFHSLCLYGSANNAIQYLGRRPVVMAGFWLDQASFSIAKKYYPYLPPKNSTVYRWPKDLLKPDHVFFVNEPLPRAFINNKHESIRYQILQVYQRWSDPPISQLYMDEEISLESVVDEMMAIIRQTTPRPVSS